MAIDGVSWLYEALREVVRGTSSSSACTSGAATLKVSSYPVAAGDRTGIGTNRWWMEGGG